MTRKDYIAIAAIIKQFCIELAPQMNDDLSDAISGKLVVPLAKVLKDDNPNFQYSLFISACGGNLDYEDPADAAV